MPWKNLREDIEAEFDSLEVAPTAQEVLRIGRYIRPLNVDKHREANRKWYATHKEEHTARTRGSNKARYKPRKRLTKFQKQLRDKK